MIFATKQLLLDALRAKFGAVTIDDTELEDRSARLRWPGTGDGSGPDARVRRYIIRYIDATGAATEERDATCYHVRINGVDEWSCNCEIEASANDLDRLRRWIAHADRNWTPVDISGFRPLQRSVDALVIVGGNLVRKAVVKTGPNAYVTADYPSVS